MNLNLVRNLDTTTRGALSPVLSADARESLPTIFGLRYLEEGAAEIHDIVGCIIFNDRPSPETATSCDDHD